MAFAAALLVAVPSTAQIHGYTRRSAVDGPGIASQRDVTVACPEGMEVLGGGARVEGNLGGTSIFRSLPAEPPFSGWRAAAAGGARSWSLRVDVICGFVGGHQEIAISTTPAMGSDQTLETECPPGKQLLGGGGRSSDPSQAGLTYMTTLPPHRWAASAWEQATLAFEWSLHASAICGFVPSREVVVGWSEPTLDLSAEHEVSCPPGKRVIGGGVEGVAGKTLLTANGPIGSRRWSGAARHPVSPSEPWGLAVTVICPEPGGTATALACLSALGSVATRRRPQRPARALPECGWGYR